MYVVLTVFDFPRAWLRMAVMLRLMKACTLDSCKFSFYSCDNAACLFPWSTDALLGSLVCLLTRSVWVLYADIETAQRIASEVIEFIFILEID